MRSVRLVFLTMNEDPEVAAEAFRIGASGYLLKRSALSELPLAIREVMNQRFYVTPLLTKGLVGSFVHAAEQPAHSLSLTARQREVLQLLAEGNSMKEVATILAGQPQDRRVSQIPHHGTARYQDDGGIDPVCHSRAHPLRWRVICMSGPSILTPVTRRRAALLEVLGWVPNAATIVAGARVVLADDHHEMLVRVTALLASEFTVVAAVADGEALIDAEADLLPDVLVIDITMPGINGLEAAALVRRRGSRVPIVFLSIHEEPEFVLAARHAGALGYVSKVRLARDLIPAVRAALDGRRFVSATVEVEDSEAS